MIGVIGSQLNSHKQKLKEVLPQIMDNRENDTIVKKFWDNIQEKSLTDEEHQ